MKPKNENAGPERPLHLEKWLGYCGEMFRELAFDSVDECIDEMRGR